MVGGGAVKLFAHVLGILCTFTVVFSGKSQICLLSLITTNILQLKLTSPVDLVPSGNRAFCPGISALFSCETKLGRLIWRSNSSSDSFLFENVSQPSYPLGIFNLSVINVTKSGATVDKVNSTAAVSSIQLSHDGVNLWCIENNNTSIKKEATIIVLGEYKLICDDNYYNCIIKLLFQHLMCHN